MLLMLTHIHKSPLVEQLRMAKITLFEFNPRGRIQVGPSGPDDKGLFSAEIDRTDEEGEEEAVEEAEDSGLSITTVLLPLVILAVIAVAVRMMTGEDEEEVEEAEIET